MPDQVREDGVGMAASAGYLQGNRSYGLPPGPPIMKMGPVGVCGTVNHWRREVVLEAMGLMYSRDPGPLDSGLRRSICV